MNRRSRRAARVSCARVATLCCLLATAVFAADESLRPGSGLPLPAAFPEPAVPADNRFSEAKAELGRYLFYDRRLSVDGSFACSTCHQQARAFTDGRVTALGATGELHRRNTMSLANVVYNGTFNWAEAATRRLEEQMLVPMFGSDPVEMGMMGVEESVLGALAADPRYDAMFSAAFPQETDPIRIENIVRAIATFERTLVSFDSPYDRYVRDGDRAALSPSAERGLELFFSPRLDCSACHAGFNLAGNTAWFGQAETELLFHNNGLYNLAEGAYPATDPGRIAETGEPSDMGRFRAPTLRNIALTAPYMHDGSIATLEEVLAHYAAGGRTIESGPYRGVGSRSRFKSEFVRTLDLSAEETEDLLAFLRSLTDEGFVTDPRLADPHPKQDVPLLGESEELLR